MTADQYKRDLEAKRLMAIVAVGAYLVALKDGEKLLDGDERKKLDVVTPYAKRFNAALGVCRI